jgi:hypothetical protein
VSQAGYCVAEVLNDASLWGKRCRSETVSSSVRPRVTIARTDVRACHERNQCVLGTSLCCEYAHNCCAVAKPQWFGDSALTGGPQTGTVTAPAKLTTKKRGGHGVNDGGMVALMDVCLDGGAAYHIETRAIV